MNSSTNRSTALGLLTARSSARKSYSIRHGDSRGQVEKIASGIVHVHVLEVVARIKHCAIVLSRIKFNTARALSKLPLLCNCAFNQSINLHCVSLSMHVHCVHVRKAICLTEPCYDVYTYMYVHVSGVELDKAFGGIVTTW